MSFFCREATRVVHIARLKRQILVLSFLIDWITATDDSCSISVTESYALCQRLRADIVATPANGATCRHCVLGVDTDDLAGLRSALLPVYLVLLFFLDKLMLQSHHIHGRVRLVLQSFSLGLADRTFLRLQNVVLRKWGRHHHHWTLGELGRFQVDHLSWAMHHLRQMMLAYLLRSFITRLEFIHWTVKASLKMMLLLSDLRIVMMRNRTWIAERSRNLSLICRSIVFKVA